MDIMSLEILKLFSTRAWLDVSQLSAVLDKDPDQLFEVVCFLRKQGYLRVESNHAMLEDIKSEDPISSRDPLEITFQGKAALESEHKISKEKRNEWIRYWITTVIALAAFIKSFFF